MTKQIKILNVVGARPNFMKIAPLMNEYAKYPGSIRAMLLHTGQHYDDSMSRIFFSELGIRKPDINLEVGSESHASQTARVMLGFEKAVMSLEPDLVVVVGDVNSTMACTLVAAKLNIAVAHIEAGLRSFDRTMPEEINRMITDSLSDLLFTTSEDANRNLLREGVAGGRICFVGNTMIDSLFLIRSKLDIEGAKRRFGLNGRMFALVTLHRPSNVDDRETLVGICSALARIEQHITLLWPLHPRTEKMLAKHNLTTVVEKMRNLIITKPLSYIDSISLMHSASMVLTDSGGIQEEATVIGIPCLTLRDNTERPVTISEGTNELVGSDPDIIVAAALRIMTSGGKKWNVPKLWDGKTGERIVKVILEQADNFQMFRGSPRTLQSLRD